jgi:hypothetical protein
MDDNRTLNLYNALKSNPKSVLYLKEVITNTIAKKIKNSKYEKDIVFYKLFINNKKFKDNLEDAKIPIYAKKTKLYDYNTSTLYAMNGPLQQLQADVADIRFLKHPSHKYVLIIVHMFGSFIYAYPMKFKSSLANKLKEFYSSIEKERDTSSLWMQTDMEFKQNEIYRLNKQFNIEMFQTKLNENHAFAAEQKIRELKKRLYSASKLFKKDPSKKVLIDAVTNMNYTKSEKYNVIPAEVQKYTVEDNDLKSLYNMLRMEKVSDTNKRNIRYWDKKNKLSRSKLRELRLGDKVLIIAYRVRKKDASKAFSKATTENIPDFNKKSIYSVVNKIKFNDIDRDIQFYYKVKSIDTNRETPGRFSRKDLFALTDNNVRNHRPSHS